MTTPTILLARVTPTVEGVVAAVRTVLGSGDWEGSGGTDETGTVDTLTEERGETGGGVEGDKIGDIDGENF